MQKARSSGLAFFAFLCKNHACFQKYFEYIAELTNQIDSCSEEGEEPIILLDNVSHPLIFSHIEECVLKKHGIFKTKGEGKQLG